jgi:hypothetical protein
MAIRYLPGDRNQRRTRATNQDRRFFSDFFPDFLL